MSMEKDRIDTEADQLRENAERLREMVKGRTWTPDELSDLAQKVEDSADTLASLVKDLRKKRD